MLTRERPQGRLRVDAHRLRPPPADPGAAGVHARQYRSWCSRCSSTTASSTWSPRWTSRCGSARSARAAGGTPRRDDTAADPRLAGYPRRAGVPRSRRIARASLIGVLSSESGRLPRLGVPAWQFQQRFRPRALAFNLPGGDLGGHRRRRHPADGGPAGRRALANGKLRQVLPEFASEGPPISVVCTPQVRQLAKVRCSPTSPRACCATGANASMPARRPSAA